MAIEKMKLVNIVGPINDFDRVVSEYLLGFDIHIENTMSVLSNVERLYPFAEENNYSETLAKLKDLLDSAGLSPEEGCTKCSMSYEEAMNAILEVEEKARGINEELGQVEGTLEKNSILTKQLMHLKSLDVDLDEIFNFKFTKFRFGRLPRAGYKKLISYLSSINAFFVECETDEDYVYGVYFMPAEEEEKIDGIFLSLYFERIIISSESHGRPDMAYEELQKERERLLIRKNELKNSLLTAVKEREEMLLQAYTKLSLLSKAAEVKKLAAHTRESFYITGWTTEKEAKRIVKSLEGEPKVLLIDEEPGINRKIEPPIRLKNWALFRPFQMFVEMYGLPSYREMDPTALLAVTYALMFGIMFGDVGQGLVLFIGGLIFYKKAKMDIGAIISLSGICSVLFGFLYGSVFGFEEILREFSLTRSFAVLSPAHDINTILISTVGIGVVVIVTAMLINIINAFKTRDWGRMLFDHNGLAGLVFYGYIIFFAVNMLLGLVELPALLTLLCLGVPAVLILLKEPLSKLLEHKKDWKPQNSGEYFLEAFFELFEIVLSYAANTISFIRLGAFALGHASMMSVVMLLAGNVPGPKYYITLVLGNILVMGLEGLVVGIQALRLQFYEMFSRYYTGEGRPFRSLK